MRHNDFTTEEVGFERLMQALDREPPVPDAEFLRALREASTKTFLAAHANRPQPQRVATEMRPDPLRGRRLLRSVRLAMFSGIAALLVLGFLPSSVLPTRGAALQVAFDNLRRNQTVEIEVNNGFVSNYLVYAHEDGREKVAFKYPSGKFEVIEDGIALFVNNDNNSSHPSPPDVSEINPSTNPVVDRLMASLNVNDPQVKAMLFSQRPQSQLEENGQRLNRYQFQAPAAMYDGQTLRVDATVNATTNSLVAMKSKVTDLQGNVQFQATAAVTGLNRDVSANRFLVVASPAPVDQIGTVEEVQGNAEVLDVNTATGLSSASAMSAANGPVSGPEQGGAGETAAGNGDSNFDDNSAGGMGGGVAGEKWDFRQGDRAAPVNRQRGFVSGQGIGGAQPGPAGFGGVQGTGPTLNAQKTAERVTEEQEGIAKQEDLATRRDATALEDVVQESDPQGKGVAPQKAIANRKQAVPAPSVEGQVAEAQMADGERSALRQKSAAPDQKSPGQKSPGEKAASQKAASQKAVQPNRYAAGLLARGAQDDKRKSMSDVAGDLPASAAAVPPPPAPDSPADSSAGSPAGKSLAGGGTAPGSPSGVSKSGKVETENRAIATAKPRTASNAFSREQGEVSKGRNGNVASPAPAPAPPSGPLPPDSAAGEDRPEMKPSEAQKSSVLAKKMQQKLDNAQGDVQPVEVDGAQAANAGANEQMVEQRQNRRESKDQSRNLRLQPGQKKESSVAQNSFIEGNSIQDLTLQNNGNQSNPAQNNTVYNNMAPLAQNGVGRNPQIPMNGAGLQNPNGYSLGLRGDGVQAGNNPFSYGMISRLAEPNSELRPGDMLRTGNEATDVVRARLANDANLFVGPASEVLLMKPTEVQLRFGELVLEIPKGDQVDLLGPEQEAPADQEKGKLNYRRAYQQRGSMLRRQVTGRGVYRIEKNQLQEVDQQPEWLTNYFSKYHQQNTRKAAAQSPSPVQPPLDAVKQPVGYEKASVPAAAGEPAKPEKK